MPLAALWCCGLADVELAALLVTDMLWPGYHSIVGP